MFFLFHFVSFFFPWLFFFQYCFCIYCCSFVFVCFFLVLPGCRLQKIVPRFTDHSAMELYSNNITHFDSDQFTFGRIYRIYYNRTLLLLKKKWLPLRKFFCCCCSKLGVSNPFLALSFFSSLLLLKALWLRFAVPFYLVF